VDEGRKTKDEGLENINTVWKYAAGAVIAANLAVRKREECWDAPY
jgi:hypothetical protein